MNRIWGSLVSPMEEIPALDQRHADMDARGRNGWRLDHDRVVSSALKAYGALATSAAKGAVRNVDQL